MASVSVVVREPAVAAFIDHLLLFLDKQSSNYYPSYHLIQTLQKAGCFLVDAEAKRGESLLVSSWLDRLQRVLYDLDDVLDDIATYNALCDSEDTHHQTSMQKARPDFDDLRKIDGIIGKLDGLVDGGHAFGLKISNRTSDSVEEAFRTFSPTAASADEFIVGRDKDKEFIVDFLLSDDEISSDIDEKISAISITGPPGIGKSTLALLAFNDERVKNRFDVRTWIYAGKNLSSKSDVVKSILAAVSGQGKMAESDNLEDYLAGKRTLIILDDVRSKYCRSWSSIREGLTAIAKGSKVIVTTPVAFAASSYQLNLLNKEDCWSLFSNLVFGNEISAFHPDFVAVAEKIAVKCGGLPLAVTALGSILRFKHIKEWKAISDTISKEENKSFKTLFLSFSMFPAYLKRCSAYCSLFPNGYEFEKEQLVRLWMAEGLLPPQDEGKSEDAGDYYFLQLLQLSFFERSFTNASRFVIHELFRDFAGQVFRNFSVMLDDFSACFYHDEIFHASYTRAKHDATYTEGKHDASNEILRRLSRAKQLRTILSFNSLSNQESFHLSNDQLQNLLANFTRLRVMSLPFYDFTEMPDSIGDLKHLRYLDFSHTALKSLPKSLTSLYNLQTLDVSYCLNLEILPEGMWKLVNLLHLLIRKSGVREMPLGIGRLSKLRTLSNFILSKGGSTISELSKLSNLRGALSISNIEILRSDNNAFTFELYNMRYLNELELAWSGESDDPEKDKSIVEYLVPSEELKRLVIEFYSGKQLPHWLGSPSFSKMVSLRLSKCKNCLLLPPLGQLPSLEVLEIEGLDGIKKLGLEICGMCSFTNRPFQSLHTLKFAGVSNWEEWETLETEDGGFPSLRELHIISCPKLKGDMPKCLPSLKTLVISKCSKLVETLSLPLTSSQCNIWIDSKKVQLRCEREDASISSTSKQKFSVQSAMDDVPKYLASSSNFKAQAAAQVEATKSSSHSLTAFNVEETKTLPLATEISTSQPDVAFQSDLDESTKWQHQPNPRHQPRYDPYTMPTQYLDEQRRLEDGYKWIRYGQMVVLGREYPRSFYKCSDLYCPARKCVERSWDGHTTKVKYHKSHNHPKPQAASFSQSIQGAENELSNKSVAAQRELSIVQLGKLPTDLQSLIISVITSIFQLHVIDRGFCRVSFAKGGRTTSSKTLVTSKCSKPVESPSLPSTSSQCNIRIDSKKVQPRCEREDASISSTSKQELSPETATDGTRKNLATSSTMLFKRAPEIKAQAAAQVEATKSSSHSLTAFNVEETETLPLATEISTSQPDVAFQSDLEDHDFGKTDDEAEPIDIEDAIDYEYYAPGILKVSDVVQLGKLPTNLHSLIIEGCDDSKFLPFKILSINPSIVQLHVIDCGFSRVCFAKGGRTTSLKTLHIQNCRELEFPSTSEMMRQCANLDHLCLTSSCESLESFPLNLFPKLETLCLRGCTNLNSLSIEEGLAPNVLEALESLEISDCPNLRSFPEMGFFAPNLTSIIISNCNRLSSMPSQIHRLKSIQSLFVSRCQELTSLAMDGLPESLNLLCIKSCDKITPRAEWKLNELGDLTHFEIEGGCASIESFPEEGLLPKSLIQLRISKLPSLKNLNSKGLEQLFSLEKLEIDCCKRLRQLPKELPSSLCFLSIKDCPTLKAKLQNKRGPDWSRVADISTVFVDDIEFH